MSSSLVYHSWPARYVRKKNLRVAIRRRERARLRDPGIAVDVQVVLLDDVSFLVAVEVGDDGEFGAGEGRLLDEDLGAHAAVDARRRVVLEARAIDVPGPEPDRRQTAVDVRPVVVVVCYVQLTRVLAAVAVAVADQGTFPLVGEGGQSCLFLLMEEEGRMGCRSRDKWEGRDRTYVVVELIPGHGDEVTSVRDI